ncbi:hypothetical protein RFI_39956 [Reticulomyxa filosa]|uniref:Uncharacterized protein n=1 Tax=Reticulomyxa filosa TaxID=46433 RepID=X6L852_RETFI|nr:hypothetical protein RFI_39956 [Reticulomyxa filosa]|eukprot:ETN97573.1 hypothetical protein RFI_39956 [Reticulomyxa filosa]
MSKDGRYSVTMNITKENCVRDAGVIDWSVGGVIYYKLPVFFEGNANAMALLTNNCDMTNMNERLRDDVNVVWTNKRTNGFVFVGRMNARGGMQTNKTSNESNDSQQSNVNSQYAKEIELLKAFSSDVTNERELHSKLVEFNGNILSVITYLVSKRRLNQVKPNNKFKYYFLPFFLKKEKTNNECDGFDILVVTHIIKKNKENNEAKEGIKEQNKLEQVSCTHKQTKILFDLCSNCIVLYCKKKGKGRRKHE